METELTILNSLRIYQPKNGYRFSQEPFVLMKNLELKDRCVFLDYGSGCGIISVLAAKINGNCFVYSLESNKEMRQIVEKNLRLNNLNNISVIDKPDKLKTNSVDIVVSNPPYFLEGSYRKSTKFFNEKFESESLDEMLIDVRRVLKNKGVLKISYHPTRLVELLGKLDSYGFGVKYITPVYGNRKKEASFIIVESKFGTKNYTIVKKAIYLGEFQYF